MKNPNTEHGQLVFHVDIKDDRLNTTVSEMMTRRSPMWSAIVMAQVMVHIAGMVDMPPQDLHKIIGDLLITPASDAVGELAGKNAIEYEDLSHEGYCAKHDTN